jgi:hypothetical protein
MNGLPITQLLFVYHYLKKDDDEYWDRLGSHLGTLWDKESLRILSEKPSGSGTRNPRIFVPLSLVVNPELPNALLNRQPADGPSAPRGTSTPNGDGLCTAMPLPEGEEVVNMGNLSKEEFFGLIHNVGLLTKT